jgi:hypothetical protein
MAISFARDVIAGDVDGKQGTFAPRPGPPSDEFRVNGEGALERPRSEARCGRNLWRSFSIAEASAIQAGTTGNLLLWKAARVCGSSFRCACTSSGGVNASHWFSETSA